MDTLVKDVRLALRRLRESPGFAVAAVLTLALGVGANTAIFGVVNGVLLRPLPFEDPEQLVFITREGDVSIPDGVDWRAQSGTFASIALFLRNWPLDLTGDGEPARLEASVVEPDYFRVLGSAPLLGRALTPDDNRPGAPGATVLSHGFWLRRMGGDSAALGRSLTLSGQQATVVGVMPPEFDFLGDRVDLWVTPSFATAWALEERGTNNFDAIGRLRAGAGIDAARAEMLGISKRLEAAYPASNRNKIVEPLPMLEFMVGGVRRSLLVLLAAVGLLLLVGAANLAGLLLARSAARQDEFAVRLALGASPRRLLQQLVVEGLVLALLAGVVGGGTALLLDDLLRAAVPEDLPRLGAIGVDLRVLGFGLLASMAAGVLFSLVPALHVVRHDPARELRAGSKGALSGGSRQRWLSALVTAEIALAFVLLAGSGLLLRTFLRLQQVELGFEPHGVLTGNLTLPEARYATREPQTRAFRQIVAGLQDLPGVEAAGFASTLPLNPRGGLGGRILIEGRAFEKNTEPGVRARLVHGDYFRAIGMRIREGRAFVEADHEDADPVAIVNQRFAAQHFPNESPLGRRIAWRDWRQEGEQPRYMTIVGVVGDVKTATLDQPDVVTVYVPWVQRRVDWQRFGFVVLRSDRAASMAGAMRSAVWAVDPSLPIADVQTMDERLSGSLGRQRFTAFATALFSTLALLLALQGVYGMLAFAVERRRREIGLRVALGARARDVANLVLSGGLRMAALGLLLGIALALLLGRSLQALLFEVGPTDPATYLAAGLVLVATTLAACLLPARRAATVDPVVALRQE
jgi:predicted permease